jgi:N6-L-threonylcarbamoyladenine synthase
MKILAIETSCDETAVSILEIRGKKKPRFEILSSVVSSQVKIHAKWGGVIPSLAKREHQRNLVPVLQKALKEAELLKISKSKFLISKQILNSILEREQVLLEKTIKFLQKYQKPKIDLIAVTNGPGLEPALWVGINFAKALAFAWNKPLIAVNHMEGHLFSVFLKENREENFQFSIFNFQFPAVALLVSGGHTQLVLAKDLLKYKLLGETRDDAAGEAFDKVAKMLKLGYPGGPIISRLASNYSNYRSLPAGRQGPTSIVLPRPMINSKDYNFSFSGLKTAVLYKLKEIMPDNYDRREVASFMAKEFQQAVIDVLISKTMAAAQEYKAKIIILAGGVAANKKLRRQFQKAANSRDSKYMLFLPEMKFTGDNAAMIALAAYFRWLALRKV